MFLSFTEKERWRERLKKKIFYNFISTFITFIEKERERGKERERELFLNEIVLVFNLFYSTFLGGKDRLPLRSVQQSLQEVIFFSLTIFFL